MTAHRTGQIVSAIPVLFMAMDAVTHLLKPAPVVEAFNHLGYPLNTAAPLGIVALLCGILYAIPRTTALGAILLTGYLGGAVATHVRVADPVFDTCFPVIVGVLVWGGLYLRDPRLRALIVEKSPQ
jgi:DoxX-like family